VDEDVVWPMSAQVFKERKNGIYFDPTYRLAKWRGQTRQGWQLYICRELWGLEGNVAVRGLDRKKVVASDLDGGRDLVPDREFNSETLIMASVVVSSA
jgi:hypothetical protein